MLDNHRTECITKSTRLVLRYPILAGQAWELAEVSKSTLLHNYSLNRDHWLTASGKRDPVQR